MSRPLVVLASLTLLACASSSPNGAHAPAVALKAPSASPPLPAPRYAASPVTLPDFDDPARGKKIAELQPILAKKIDAFFAEHQPPSLAVAMVVDGRVVVTRALGVRDKSTKAPATDSTMYRIGSVSKTFAATMILSLRDEGRLRLDDPAESYLPELASVEYPFRDAPRITLRHLLTHTSGLPRLGDFDYTGPNDVTEKEMLSALSRTKLRRAPGTGYEYSNFGMALVGALVARIAPEKSLHQSLASRITRPLSMAHTAFDPKEVEAPELASGYAKAADAAPASLWHLGASEAAGGLWSTAPDMAKWIAAQLDAWPAREDADSPFVKRATLREAHTPTFSLGLDAKLDGDHLAASSSAIGFAWHTEETCAYERIVWHNGGVDGFSSYIGFAPERGFGFVVLASSLDTPTDELGKALFAEVAPVLGPRKMQPARETRALVEKLAAAHASCSEKDYNDLLTSSFRSAVPFPQVQEICRGFAKTHGTCRLGSVVKVDDPRSGTFELSCDRGGIEVKAGVVDEDGQSRFQMLLMRDEHGKIPGIRIHDRTSTTTAHERCAPVPKKK